MRAVYDRAGTRARGGRTVVLSVDYEQQQKPRNVRTNWVAFTFFLNTSFVFVRSDSREAACGWRRLQRDAGGGKRGVWVRGAANAMTVSARARTHARTWASRVGHPRPNKKSANWADELSTARRALATRGRRRATLDRDVAGRDCWERRRGACRLTKKSFGATQNDFRRDFSALELNDKFTGRAFSRMNRRLHDDTFDGILQPH